MATATLPPKIVYPSGGGTTLNLEYYPRFVAAENYEATRSTNEFSGGQSEAIYTRTDTFLELSIMYVGNSRTSNEILGWFNFMEYAMYGGAFDYYPTRSTSSHDTYTLEDRDWTAAYEQLATYQFKVTFRKYIAP